MSDIAPAGWYPAPGGKPGQMYWDGQRWHDPIPATSQPAWGQAQQYVDMARPQLDKGQHFWSRQSAGGKFALILVGLFIVVAVIAVPLTLFGGSGSAGEDSDDYKNGFASGQGTTVAGFVYSGLTPESACDSMLTTRQIAFKTDRDPFMRGCVAGYQQAHP